MAKNKVYIDVQVDDKGTTKRIAVNASKLGDDLGKVGRGAQEADRNLKGAARASSGAGKNFAKLSQGAGGLVGAYAALAASLFAVSAAYNFLKRAGDLQALQTGQEAYASATGIALKSLTNDIIAATDAQITFRDAAQAAAIGTAAGLATDQLKQLGKAAKDASIVLGRDVTDSFNRLVRGVTKAEPELLDELGIILRLETATKAYAQQIGKSAKDLTAFERSQAVANDVLAQAEDKYGRILEVTGGSANEFAQLGKAFDDIVMQIQEVVSTVAGPLAKVFTETPALALASFGLLAKGPLAALGISFGDLAVSAKASAEAATANLDEVKKKAALATNNVEALSKNFTGLGKSIKEAGASAKFLNKIEAGDALSGIDKANVKKSLNAAKASVNEFGIVTKGVFKGVALSMVLEFEKGFLALDAAEKGKLSRTKVWGAKMASAYATAAAGVKTLAASLATGLNVLLGWLSWIGLAVTAFLALREQFGFFKQELTDAEKLYQRNAEKISDVVEELENFAAIQLILAEGNTTKGFAAIGNVFENFDKSQLQQLTEEIKNYSKAQKERLDYDEQTAAMTKAQARSSAGSRAGGGVFGAGFVRSLFAPEVSEEAQEANEVITAVTDTLDGLESKFGVTSIAGNDFKKALEDLRNGVPGAEKAFEKAVGRVIEFGNAMEQLPRLSAEANDAFGGFKQSLAPISQGQRAINALRSEIETLEKAQREISTEQIGGGIFGKKKTQVDTRLEEAKKNLKFAETLETNQFKRQQEILKVKQMQEQVDLRRIPAEQNIYSLAGKIANQYVQQQNIKGEIADIEAIAAEAGRKVNDSEDARIKKLEAQSAVLDAQIDGNKQRLQVAVDTLSIEQQLYNLKIDNRILSAEQAVLNVAQKQLDIQQRLLAVRERRANLQLEREMITYERENPFAFLDQQRVEAEKRYELEKKLSADKIAQVEAEKDLKLKMIDLEYDLLDAKMLQTQLELEAAAAKPENAAYKDELLGTAAKVGQARSGLDSTRETAKQAVEGEAANAVLAIVTNLEKLKLAKDNLSEMGQITDALSDSFGNGLVNAINGVITGSMNMKTAMLGMAKAVVQALAQVIAKLIAIKLLESAIGFFGGGFGGPGGPGPQAGMTDFSSGLDIGAIGRNGGIFEKASGYRYGGLVEKFAGGGIAKGREAGYPAILHGTEAVVPLPNGKEIPVEMRNGGTQQNNVTVNVTVDGNGSSTQDSRSDGKTGADLGNVIAIAVQKELQNQKRAGGILSPYGVA